MYIYTYIYIYIYARHSIGENRLCSLYPHISLSPYLSVFLWLPLSTSQSLLFPLLSPPYPFRLLRLDCFAGRECLNQSHSSIFSMSRLYDTMCDNPIRHNYYLIQGHACKQTLSGASIHPEAMMHFSPVFRFPLFTKNFSDSVENFPNFTFSNKIYRFSSARISDDFFSAIDHKFRIPPIFAIPIYFTFPLFREILHFPHTFQNSL